ncbi:hypothetical protein D6C81_08855 [Aureobasidium pullulans]|nr:hypothetical protein D6C81_08855 [Aureobasidium pullulans]
MYYWLDFIFSTAILSLASAADDPYVGLSLGSRTVILASLTDSGNVSITARIPVDSAYISWFEEAVELEPKYGIPADNAALIDFEIYWKPLQIAYGFDLPQNLGLPKDFDWSAKVEPLVLHIEYNWNFMGFQLIHIYKAAASLEHDAMFKGFTDVNYLGTDQKSATGIENQLSILLAKHIRPPGPSTPPGDHFYIPDLRAVIFSGDAPPHAFDVLRTAVEKVMEGYPYAQLYDTIRPSELFAVGAAKYAQFLVEFHRDFNPHGGHEEL